MNKSEHGRLSSPSRPVEPEICSVFSLLFPSDLHTHWRFNSGAHPIFLIMASSGQLSPEMAAENKGPGILAACYTVEVIATFFVAARLFVRGRMMGKWQLDDWLIIVSMVRGPSRAVVLQAHPDHIG